MGDGPPNSFLPYGCPPPDIGLFTGASIAFKKRVNISWRISGGVPHIDSSMPPSFSAAPPALREFWLFKKYILRFFTILLFNEVFVWGGDMEGGDLGLNVPPQGAKG